MIDFDQVKEQAKKIQRAYDLYRKRSIGAMDNTQPIAEGITNEQVDQLLALTNALIVEVGGWKKEIELLEQALASTSGCGHKERAEEATQAEIREQARLINERDEARKQLAEAKRMVFEDQTVKELREKVAALQQELDDKKDAL